MRFTLSNIIFQVVLVTIYLNCTCYAQSQSNLEVLNTLVEESVIKVVPLIDNNSNVFIEYFLPVDMGLFKTRLIIGLNRSNINISTALEDSDVIFNYTLAEVFIKYNNMFRDGIFGDYFVEREARINGSLFLVKNEEVINSDKFSLSRIDTVNYNDIHNFENNSLPFTQSKIPEESFFPSLVEPLIAVATAVVTIFLFFTIRSK